MVTEAEIRQFVDRVVESFSPERVILFGSHARGDAATDSDVDLLVVMPTTLEPLDQAVEIRRRVRRSFPLDLIVKTPTEFDRRLALGDGFLTAIATEGKTLYESVGA
jgi:uncharacterized protein